MNDDHDTPIILYLNSILQSFYILTVADCQNKMVRHLELLWQIFKSLVCR